MSLLCPKCGHKASCYDSRQRTGPAVTRLYRCNDCSCQFSTCEVIVTIDKQPAPSAKRHGTARSMVERLECQVLSRGRL